MRPVVSSFGTMPLLAPISGSERLGNVGKRASGGSWLLDPAVPTLPGWPLILGSILRWMASHVSVATDPAGNIKPVKPDRNRGSKRIDGIVAAILAIGRETLRERSGSVYDRRGLMVLDW